MLNERTRESITYLAKEYQTTKSGAVRKAVKFLSYVLNQNEKGYFVAIKRADGILEELLIL